MASFPKFLQTQLLSFDKLLLRKAHPLRYLFWEVTLRCNFACKHCGSNAGPKPVADELSTKEIKSAFKDIAGHSNSKSITVAVTGGEPLLRKDLLEVMDYACWLGFPWGMVTNGFLVTKKNVQKMKKTGMQTVVVSIDGLGETHDEFRNTKGSYKKAIRAVRLLVEANFLKDVQITTSVHQKNIMELEQMYRAFLPLGITSWRVMNADPIGRAEDNKEVLISPPQLRELLEFIKKMRRSSPIKVTYGCAGFLGNEFENKVRDWYFACNAGITVGSILHNGDIFVCPNVSRRKDLIQGNVRRDSFSDVWESKFGVFRDKNRTACLQCKSCTFWEECLGGSFHLWDFAKKKPKMCHLKMLGGSV